MNKQNTDKKNVHTRARAIKRYRFTITGIVQGVGFRPYLFRLAQKHHLSGRVYNSTVGVVVEIQGAGEMIDKFYYEVLYHPPLQAVVESIREEQIELIIGSEEFSIDNSCRDDNTSLFIGPDLGLCSECSREIRSKSNRLFRYPFTNCTNCGPRYTIIKTLPYDREKTTMKDFTFCVNCSQEYNSQWNRRFHAESISCPSCGPSLILYKVTPSGTLLRENISDILSFIGQALNKGEIVAIKGLGGFHLAGDSTIDETVLKIRKMKGRDEKPLAIMCCNPEQVQQLCLVTAADLETLTSSARPIVLMERRRNDFCRLSPWIAPGQARLGVMLPYTPLHQILLDETNNPLVLTSCNLEFLPMITDISQFTSRIRQGLDYILTNDRQIAARCDDSVMITSPHRILIRRARGVAPAPLQVPETSLITLGVGGDLKNTVCFIKQKIAVITPHIGTIENEEMLEEWRSTITHFKALLNLHPELVACDLHPSYITRQASYELELPVVEVQHHHAHIAACMAENNLSGSVLGIALDGTGYGSDGTIWGGELLGVEYTRYHRLGSLFPVKLPGGDQAVREPWRMALAYLYDTYGDDIPDFPGGNRWNESDAIILKRIIRKDFFPMTTSAGRLFDAVVSLFGIYHVTSFEGQAAMALESLAQSCKKEPDSYTFEIVESEGCLRLVLRDCFKEIIEDLKERRSKTEIARAFHITIANGICAMCKKIRKQTGLNRAVLSGGVFQNEIILTEIYERLNACGFTVYTHQLLPPNDGGLSLGQCMVAALQVSK